MNKTIEITFKDALNESFLEILRSIIKVAKDDKGLNGDLNNSIPEINLKGANAIRIKVNNTEKVISEIFQAVPKNGMEIENISVDSPSLEEIFLSVVSNSKDNSNSGG